INEQIPVCVCCVMTMVKYHRDLQTEPNLCPLELSLNMGREPAGAELSGALTCVVFFRNGPYEEKTMKLGIV
ncbi:hypothetical protein M9458_050643, partial [Cirrhinus mrigala]